MSGSGQVMPFGNHSVNGSNGVGSCREAKIRKWPFFHPGPPESCQAGIGQDFVFVFGRIAPTPAAQAILVPSRKRTLDRHVRSNDMCQHRNSIPCASVVATDADHSGSPAFRRPSINLAESSGRNGPIRCLRLETCNSGSSWRARTINPRASSRRPERALLAAASRMEGRKFGRSRHAISAGCHASSYRPE